MADLNYLNPTSIAPKFDWQPKNALAGMSWVENRADYRNLFEQQLRLQQMAEEERRLELESKRKDVPLKDAEREGKLSFTLGQNPYQQQLGSTGAQAQINTNQIQGSPERRSFEIDRFKQGLNDNQWTQYQRSMGVVGPMVEQAMQISKTQGPMAAQQWIAQNAQQAARAGVDLPAYIMDPSSWEPLYNAAVQTTKHAQEISKIDREGMHRLNATETSGAYSLQQGRERNASSERIAGMNVQGRADVAANRAANSPVRYSTDQRINALSSEIASIPDGTEIPIGKIRELQTALAREYEKYATQGIPIRTLAPELQQQHIENQRKYVMDKLNALGISAVPTGGGQQPNPSGGQRKPLGSFD